MNKPSYPKFDLLAELNELDEDLYRDDSGFVYLLACQDSAGTSYVKIGCTVRPVSRMTSLLTACPMEPSELALCEVFRCMRADSPFTMARHLEQSLHKDLAHKRARGEWFHLDLKSQVDKAEFTVAWKRAISRLGLSPKPWHVISMADFRKRKKTRGSINSSFGARMAWQQKQYVSRGK